LFSFQRLRHLLEESGVSSWAMNHMNIWSRWEHDKHTNTVTRTNSSSSQCV